ncbi:aminotransferase DegT [Helicobacter enhydrae]|uniref:Aminotransferase DegT n=1 Tax=Helicobacter enhydrae TaxID=222136 RepID=A0A1B1U3U4_9HELI|nr:DegT/DnrJ/EryC1/StrS family aminotransferase [Helicobacter enhydrae]ANV97447.1 aminotransferase DegT [Helicobacter enhydrae]
MKIDFANLQRQYQAYKAQIDLEINQVLQNSSYIMGESVGRLENALREYTQAHYAIACSSGTDALVLILMALGISRDDEVITTPFSFFATSEAIALVGAKPVFVDIDTRTYNLDVSLVPPAITPKTKAILAVSLYGQPCDMEALAKIACEHHLALIEDAAQSFGGSLGDRKSCNLSPFASTSFFPSKPLGCYGDGGAVFLRDEAIAHKVVSLLQHGQAGRYKHRYLGMNARMDSIQAGVLCAKLKYLDIEIRRRNEIAGRYSEGLENAVLPYVANGYLSAFGQYSVLVENRDRYIEHLKLCGIPTAVHYPTPLHLQEAFGYLGYQEGDFPVSERIAKRILSLPMNAFLEDREIDYIIQAFNQKTIINQVNTR